MLNPEIVEQATSQQEYKQEFDEEEGIMTPVAVIPMNDNYNFDEEP